MMAGNYMGIFFVYCDFSKKCNRAISNARRPDMGEITAHLSAGTMPPGKLIRKRSSWSMVGPLAVNDAKLQKNKYKRLHLTLISVSIFCVEISLRECLKYI